MKKLFLSAGTYGNICKDITLCYKDKDISRLITGIEITIDDNMNFDDEEKNIIEKIKKERILILQKING